MRARTPSSCSTAVGTITCTTVISCPDGHRGSAGLFSPPLFVHAEHEEPPQGGPGSFEPAEPELAFRPGRIADQVPATDDLVYRPGSDELDMTMVYGGIEDDPHRITSLVPAQGLGSTQHEPEWPHVAGQRAGMHGAPRGGVRPRGSRWSLRGLPEFQANGHLAGSSGERQAGGGVQPEPPATVAGQRGRLCGRYG